jgi:hypothetical protein
MMRVSVVALMIVFQTSGPVRHAIYPLHRRSLAAIAAARPSLFKLIRGIVRATDSLRRTACNR